MGRFNILFILLFLIGISGCNSDGHKELKSSIVVDKSMTVSKNVFSTRYIITGSNLVIDFNNFRMTGNCNDNRCVGIIVKGTGNTIKNVNITKYKAGITISSTAHNTTITNADIFNNIYHAIYVNPNVKNFTCDNCKLTDNGTMGIYLDRNSEYAVIKGGTISDNGYRNKDTGSVSQNIKDSFKVKREGIAIDASRYNIISNVTFKNNALAGITTYRNCGEKGIIRKHGSDYNTFQNNIFDRNNLWIASRQDRNLSTWDCTDKYRDHPNLPKDTYIEDHSEYNNVLNNTFKNGAKLLIHDDNNSSSGNNVIPDKNSEIRLLIGEIIN